MKTTRRTSLRTRRSVKLWLNSLEHRVVPANYYVTTTLDTGTGSLRQAITDANSNSGLDSIIVTAAAGSVTLGSALPAITDSVTIDGTGAANFIINGNGSYRGLSIIGSYPTITVTINDIAVENCVASSGNGGGISVTNSASAILNNCLITDNSASDAGGGIYVAYGQLALSNTTVSLNQADHGAGIAAGYATISLVSSSVVESNVADAAGGGIHAFHSPVTINSSTILSNSSATSGGGIYSQYGGLTVEQSEVALNSATAFGIGICVTAGTLDVSSSTITANLEPANLNSSHGGGIYSTVPTSILGSTIKGNNAAYGAGLEVSGSSGRLTLIDSKILTNGTFGIEAVTNNILGALEGGGVRLNGVSTVSGNESRIHGTLFQQNKVGHFGGAIQVVGAGNLIISAGNSTIGATFIANTAGDAISTPNVLGAGGGINIANLPAGSSVSISDSKFLGIVDSTLFGNRSPLGACLAIRNLAGSVAVRDSQFSGNGSDASSGVADKGGAIYVGDTTSTTGVVDLERLEVGAKGDYGGNYTSVGGGIYIGNTQSKVTITSSTINSNNAVFNLNNLVGGFGGGLAVEYAPRVTVRNSLFWGNTAGVAGGGIAYPNSVTHDTSTYNIQNTTIYANTADVGGGLYLNSGKSGSALLAVFGSTIAANTATVADESNPGGGIKMDGFVSSDRVLLDSTIIAGNFVETANKDSKGPDIGSSGSDAKNNNVDSNYSLIGVANNGNYTLSGIGNVTGTLTTPASAGFATGELENNGGATKTIALASTSNAINAGRNYLDQMNDQRGTGYFRVQGPRADMGAYEYKATGQVPASVAGIVINGGAVQRSRLLSVEITFNVGVELPYQPNADAMKSAFRIRRQSDSLDADFILATNVAIGATAVTITFPDQVGQNNLVEHKSLEDGRYTLTLFADKLSSGNFDGDGNGTAGDDYQLASAAYVPGTSPGAPGWVAPTNIYRLFGDFNGTGSNGYVEADDFTAFQLVFLSASDAFDSNANGTVDTADYLRFRLNFLKVI